MSIRVIAVISICLNVTFAAWCVVRSAMAASTTDPNSPSAGITAFQPRPTPVSSVAYRETVGWRQPVWGSIRSDDLGIYTRNLRASGCPEPVIQGIIVEELDRIFAARWQARPIDTNFWRSGPQRDAARAESNRAKRELERERRG